MKRIRVARGMSLRELEELLNELGHGIAHSGLSKIENTTRRVDVDDLLAIALALNVSPLALLLPDKRDPEAIAKITGTSATIGELWYWAQGNSPLPHDVGVEKHGEHETWTPEGYVARSQDFLELASPWWQQRPRQDSDGVD